MRGERERKRVSLYHHKKLNESREEKGCLKGRWKQSIANDKQLFNGHYNNEILHPIIPKHSLEVPSQDCEYHFLCGVILMSSENGVQIGSTIEL